MFDRIVVINLDSRPDRMAAFAKRAMSLRSLAGWVRQRAVPGDIVGVPGYFQSGGGAWGCRCSHVEAIQSALMDGVGTLLVLEDDCRLAADFDIKLGVFLEAVPSDWAGLMLGGQHHEEPVFIGPGVVKTKNTQRTHAYAVRGKDAMRDLYRLWVRADRHIDHLFHRWQAKWPVYASDPFLCGQDAGRSDISSHVDGVRFWTPAPAGVPLYLLDVSADVAGALWRLGATWGPDRGVAPELAALAAAHWPAKRLAAWAENLVATVMDEDVPCLWQPGADWKMIAERAGRPTIRVAATTVEDAVVQIPVLHRAWRAGRVTWLLKGEPPNRPGLVGGRPADRSRLARLVAGGDYGSLPGVVRSLTKEAGRVRRGRVLVAHPQLDAGAAMDALENAAELVGDEADWSDQMAAVGLR